MSKYRDELVQTIKLMGQELIDRAESMVHDDCDMITNFNINIDIPQPMDGCPELTWSTSVISTNFYNKKLGHSAGDAKMETHVETIDIDPSSLVVKKEPVQMYISVADPLNNHTTFTCPRCGTDQVLEGMRYCEDHYCPNCNILLYQKIRGSQ